MANTLKFGNGEWAIKEGSALAYNDENGNFKPLPFDFTRASTATYVAEDGLIKTAAIGEPRIDFLNDSDGALKLEPQRTNKVSTSNDFNGGGWNISNLTATANQIISPDGTLNASKLEMTGNGSLRNQSEASFNDGYAYSIFVKKGNSRYVTIRSAFFTQSFNCGFDLDTLTTEANGKIEDYGNDWYRLSITKDISGDVDRSGFFYVYLPNSLGSQTSVSGNYVYAYGGQIEDGKYPTSYIPTQGSTVTRVGESSLQGGFQDKNIFGSTEGSIVIEFKIEEINYIFDLNDNLGIRLRLFNSSNTTWNIRDYGGASWYNTGFNIEFGQNIKIGIKWDGTNVTAFMNGVKSSTTYTFASSMAINSISTDKLNNKSVMKLYNTALTDQELQELTTL